jgi:hypothetical protein
MVFNVHRVPDYPFCGNSPEKRASAAERGDGVRLILPLGGFN